MGLNRIRRLVSDQLDGLVGAALGQLQGPSGGSYPIPLGLVQDLAQGAENLSQARIDRQNAQNEYRAAVRRHEDAREACAESMARVANLCYASSSVDAAMIAGLGLSPRSTSTARIVPKTPPRLRAAPDALGEVRLDWDRGDNPEGVVFVLEELRGGGWTFLEASTRCRARLSGYAPGLEASFRVTATKNGKRSAPSPWATIYPARRAA